MNPISKIWLRNRHRIVRKRNSIPSGFCVDVGCGEYPLYDFTYNIDVEDLPCVNKIVNVDVEELPFQDNCVDVIFCLEVIEHLENPQYFLDEVYRVLKLDGKLVLTTPNENSFWWRLIWAMWNRSFGKEWHHQNKFNLEMLRKFTITNYGRINLFLQYIEVRK